MTGAIILLGIAALCFGLAVSCIRAAMGRG